MWLDKIECTDRRLYGKVVDAEGAYTNVDMTSAWKLPPRVPKLHRITGDTYLKEWRQIKNEHYLSATGDILYLSNSHQIYSFYIDDVKILVPALAVIKALLGPPSSTFQFLFRPSGLDAICAPIFNKSGVTIEMIRQSINNYRSGHLPKNHLQWLYCFPTARIAWDSVYTFATKGIIGISLPDIRASASVHGDLRGETLFAASISFNHIEALDCPFEWAGDQPKCFFAPTKHNTPRPKRRLKRHDIPRGGKGWEVSDDEWKIVSELIFRGRKSILPHEQVRQNLDAVLVKLGTGCSWEEINSRIASASSSSSFYSKVRRNGIWDKIASALLKTRQ
ncbi:transposase [Burkholderia pyrrocinia]|uniref:transposase n=1 Tax=Burkholderia pyrrocinia TaxID=60550 RepID=UPI002AB2186E|nr:transposase [Burkholderia pyrrocinia]